MLVCVGVNGPAHALLGALVAHKRIADGTVILFGLGTCLHQFCLAALAIASNDVATRLFVKANDALVAKEVAFVIVVVLFRIGFSFGFVFGFGLILGIHLVNLKLLILGLGKCGGAFTFLDGTLNGNLFLHAELRLELHKLGDCLHHLLGSGTELLALALGDGGSVGLLDNLLGGFDDMLFNNGSLSRVCRCALGDNGMLNGLCRRSFEFLCNNGSFGNLVGLLKGFFDVFLDNLFFNFFLVFLSHHSFLGGGKIGNSLLRLGVALVIVVIVNDLLLGLVFLLVNRFLCDSSRLCCRLLCGSLSSSLSLHNSSLLFRSCGNEQIALGITNNQEQAKNKRTYRCGDGQHPKGQLCRGRYCAKGKSGYGIVRPCVVIIIVIRQVYLTAARATQFADEHTNACDFGTENTRQNSNGDIINVLYTQTD